MGSRNSSSYPGLLAITNVILLIASTILIFLGSALITFYQLDKLGFISPYFYIVPYIMVGLGIFSFVLALYGLIVAAAASRLHLILFSVLMIAIFVTQLVGVFAAIELRAVINSGEAISGVNIIDDLEDYAANPATQYKWDTLQREFHCCGGINFNNGYKIWRNSDIGLTQNSVPDSCCLRPEEKCGRNIFTENVDIAHTHIYTHGCLTIIEEKLVGQVVPVLLGYAGVGTCLALIQLLTIVFACSYSSQISRSKNVEVIYEDARSLGRSTLGRSSTYRGEHFSTGSLPMTPRADLIRGAPQHGGYVAANMSSVFVNDDGSHRKLGAESPTSDMDEREV